MSLCAKNFAAQSGIRPLKKNDVTLDAGFDRHAGPPSDLRQPARALSLFSVLR